MVAPWAVKEAADTVHWKSTVVVSPNRSAAVTETGYGVPRMASSAGLPEIVPLAGSITSPSGRLWALKLRARPPGSLALIGKVTLSPAVLAWSPGVVRSGGA